MADRTREDFMYGDFDPDNLTQEELPEAMGAISTILAQACEHAFPIEGNPKRAELVACALLTVTVRYALMFNKDPMEWLKKQIELNEAHRKAEKAGLN